MGRGRLLGLGVGTAVLLVGASCLPGWMMGPSIPAVTTRQQDMIRTLVLNGRVLAPRRVNLGTQQAGIVARRHVEEGDRVQAGQILANLEDAEARAQVAQARAALDQLRQVTDPSGQAGLKQAEATLQQAEAAYRRADRLFREGVLPEAQVEEARKALEVARAGQITALAQATSTRNGAALRAATAALALAEARLEQLCVRAPAAGVLLTRTVEQGDVVNPGRVLFTMTLDEPLQLLVQPDEKHLAQLAVGQKALASADAFPENRFEARVSYLAPAVDLQRGTVDVKLAVPNPPAFLRADMTITVDIHQGQRAQALVLPMAAVRGLPDHPHVLVRREGRAERVNVRTGFRGEGLIEIVEGLRPGEVVFTGAVQPGQRARGKV